MATEKKPKKPAVKKPAKVEKSDLKKKAPAKTEVKKKKGGAQPGSGRPPHRPTEETREQVEIMVMAGIKHTDIALCLGITDDTLVKYYREEIDTSTPKANARVAASLFKQATELNIPASAIFWAKTRMGWSEKSQVEHSGKIDSDVKQDSTFTIEYVNPPNYDEDYTPPYSVDYKDDDNKP